MFILSYGPKKHKLLISYPLLDEKMSEFLIPSLFKSVLCSPQDFVKESHLIPPSPVVHVRGLCDAVVEADLVEVLEKFGTIW